MFDYKKPILPLITILSLAIESLPAFVSFDSEAFVQPVSGEATFGKTAQIRFPAEMTYFIRDREERKLCLGTDSITLLDFQARLLDGKHFPSPLHIGQQMTFVADRPQKKNPGSARGIDLI